MILRLVNIRTEKKSAETNDQPIKSANDAIAHVEIKGDLDNDAANRRLDESAKDRFWLYREAARFGLSFDLYL
jgi:hypothetical protein